MFRQRDLRQQRLARSKHQLQLEHLEDRRLMSITSSFQSGALSVSTDDSIEIVIASVEGYVTINGESPSSGAIAAASVQSLHVTGGAVTTLVDLSGVGLGDFSALPGATIDFDVGNQPVPASLPLFWPTEGAPEDLLQDGTLPSVPPLDFDLTRLPLPLERPDAVRFAKLAETLIGPNWSEALNISNVSAFLRTAEWQNVLTSKLLAKSLNSDRFAEFAQAVVGADWTQRLGIDDLPAFLKSGAWRDWFGGQNAGSATPLIQNANERVSGFLKGSELGRIPTADTAEWDSLFELQVATAINPTSADDSTLGLLSPDRLITLAEAVVGPDWEQKLGLTDGAAAFADEGYRALFANSRLDGALDPVRFSNFAAKVIGPDWAERLGVTNLPSLLKSGGWREAWLGANAPIYVASDVAVDVRSNFAEVLDSPELLEAELGEVQLVLPAPSSLPNVAGFGNQAPVASSAIPIVRIIKGTAGNDIIIGTDDDENIDGGEGDDEIDSRGGNDQIDGAEGDDDIVSGNGDDQLDGGEGNDALDAGKGNDGLYGSLAGDALDGGEGNDVLQGGIGNDYVDGGEGDDTYVFAGAYSLDTDTLVETGALDVDTVDFSQLDFGAGVNFDFGSNGTTYHVIQAGDLSLILNLSGASNAFDNVIGTQYDDVLLGNSFINRFEGGGGNDTLIGGDGDDTYVFSGSASLETDSILEGDEGGQDTLDFSLLAFGAGVTADLASASSAYEVINYSGKRLALDLTAAINQIENATGTIYSDVLLGNSLANILDGNGGGDLLLGGSQIDYYTLPSQTGSSDRIVEVDDQRIDVAPAWPAAVTLSESNNVAQAVAIDSSGNSLHVWLADVVGGTALVGRWFDEIGTPLTPEFTVASGNVQRPVVAISEDGESIISWQVNSESTSDLYYRRYSIVDGLAVGGTIRQINPAGLLLNHRASTVVLADGSVAAVWQAIAVGGSGHSDVYFQKFDAQDQALSTNPTIVHGSAPTTDQELGKTGTSIAVDADGGFAVAWREGQSIFVRRLNASGAPLGSSTEITGPANQVTETVVDDPSLVFDEEGDLSVIWWQQVPQSGAIPVITQIMLRRLLKMEDGWQPEVLLTTFNPSSSLVDDGPSHPRLLVASDGLGHLGIVRSDSEESRSLVQWFTSDGESLTAAVSLNLGYWENSSRTSAIAATADGKFIVTSSRVLGTEGRLFTFVPPVTVPQFNVPVLEEIETQVATVGSPYSLDLHVNYPGGTLANVAFALSGAAPSGMTLVPSATTPGLATLQWNTAAASPGLHAISIDVFDAVEPTKRSRTVVTIWYGEENDAPIVPPIADQSIIIGETLLLAVAASDPDGPATFLRYALGSNAPDGMRINAVTGEVRWTPTISDLGENTFDVLVTDRGQPAQTTPLAVSISVLPQNVVPTLNGPTSVSLAVNSTAVFNGGSSITVGDADSSGSDLQLTLISSYGTFQLGGTTGLEFLVGNSGNPPTRLLQVRGTASELNAALLGLTFAPDQDFTGRATLEIQLNDLGNGGTHPAEEATRSIALDFATPATVPTIAAQTFNRSYQSVLYSGVNPITIPIGTIQVTNPELGRLLRFSKISGDPVLNVDPLTGLIRLMKANELDAATQYPLTVRVSYADSPTSYSEAVMTVAIAPAAYDPPVGNADTISVTELATVTGNIVTNDTFESGDTKAVAIAYDSSGRPIPLGVATELPSGATLTLNSDGTFTYDSSSLLPTFLNLSTPSLTPDKITYRAVGQFQIASALATVTFQFTKADLVHTVPNQTWWVSSTATGTTKLDPIIVSDRESGGVFDKTYYSIDPASNPGTLFTFGANDADAGKLIFNASSLTQDRYDLTVYVRDNQTPNRIATGVVTILRGVPVPFVTFDALLEATEGVPLVANLFADRNGVLGGATLPLGSPQVYTVNGKAFNVGQTLIFGSGARLSIAANGDINFDPRPSEYLSGLAAGQSSTESIAVSISNGSGTYVTRTLSIDVRGRNEAPVPRNDVFEMFAGSRYRGNVLQSIGGEDRDLDGADVVRVTAINGQSVVDEITVTTDLGASLTIKRDGSFDYDPSGVSGVAGLINGSRLYDSFTYSISDGLVAGVRDGVAQIKIIGNIQNEEPPPEDPPLLTIDDFQLVMDTGSSSTDRRTTDPTVMGTLGGDALSADHIIVEFDLNAGNLNDESQSNDFDMTLSVNHSMTLTSTSSGFPDFSYYPSSNSAFVAGARRQVIAYRARAFQTSSSSSEFATTPWQFFSFEVLNVAAGEVYLEDPIHIYNNTGDFLAFDPDTGTANNVNDQTTSDPRLAGTVAGDFAGYKVRVEFKHTRSGVTYTDNIDLTAPAEFIYDPRISDTQMVAQGTTYGFNYRLLLLNATTDVQVREITSGDAVLTYASPATSQAIVSLSEDTAEQNAWLQTTRQIKGTISQAKEDQESVFVELYFSTDASTPFGTTPDAEVLAVRDFNSTSGTGNLTFSYTADGVVGSAPRVKARVREWSDIQGDYVNGPFSAVLNLAPPTAPSIQVLTIAPPNEVEFLTLRGSLVANGAAQTDLMDLGSVTVEFFHQGGSISPNAVPHGTAITDTQGNFEYSPRGLSYSTTTITARTTITLPGTTTKVYSTLPNKTISVTLAVPVLPLLPLANLQLTVPGTSQIVQGKTQWNTDDPQISGLLTQAVATGVPMDAVTIEFAHDYGGSGQSTQVVGYAFPDSEGRFSYKPVNMATGAVRVRARVGYYDEYSNTTLYSSTWTDLYLNVTSRTNSLVEVKDLHLVNPAVGSGGTPHSTDPTIAGRITDAEDYLAFVAVEFRNHATEAALGAGVTDTNGNFTVTLSGITPGTVTVDARARDWNYETGQFVWGDWTQLANSLTFVLDAVPALSISQFALHSDTGTSQSDGHTANPLLFGRVAGATDLGDVTVGLDFGDNGSMEATVKTDEEGLFSYLPVGWANGNYSVRAKLGAWNATTGAMEYSNGPLVTFTLEAQANSAAKLLEFALANPPSGGSIVTDATLIGRIINETAVEGVTVEFDYDTNDVNGVNQSTETDSYGRFHFEPTLLAAGTANVRARTREWNSLTASWLMGSWTTLASFTYQPTVMAPAITGYGLVLLPDLVGPPQVTDNAEVKGTIAGTGTLDQTLVEFSFTENGPVIGTATANSTTRQFKFTPPNLLLGATYTIWARTKVLSATGQAGDSYGPSVSVTYKYALTGQAYLTSARLSVDTAAESGSSATDGVTSNTVIVGQISTLASGVTIMIDVGADNQGIQSITTQSGGTFSYTVQASAAGYYTVRIGVGTTWRRVNFIYTPQDGNATSLALASSLAGINTSWQSIDADLQALYELSQAGNEAQRDYDLALAALERDQNQQNADAAYEQERNAADAAYRQALSAAQSAFNAAISALSAADRAAFDGLSFLWPKAPDDNALVIPADQDQPAPPAGPVYSGSTLDYTRIAAYRSASAQADQAYATSVRAAEEDYRESLPDIEQEYRDDVQEANDRFREAVDDARDEYNDLRGEGPEFDDEGWHELVDAMRNAWKSYQDEVRANNDSYYSIYRSAMEAFNEEYESIRSAKQPALDDILQANLSSAAREERINRLNRRYGSRFEDMYNTRDDAINPALRDRDVANAAALKSALTTVYAIRRDMASFSRQDAHEQLADRLSDTHEHTALLAVAQEGLQADLAIAQNIRTKSIAEQANVRDRAIANAQATRDQTLAESKLDAITSMVTANITPWTQFQLELATAEDEYQRALIDLQLTHNQGLADADQTYSNRVADAVSNRTIARATAERERTVELDELRRDFRIESDSEYVARDTLLAGAWHIQQQSVSVARYEYVADAAEIAFDYEQTKDHANNSHSAGVQGIAGPSWYDGWVPEGDNETRAQMWRDLREVLRAAERDRMVAMSYVGDTYAFARIDAVEAYRVATNDIYHDAAFNVAGLNSEYRIDVAIIQDDYNVAIAQSAMDYSLAIEQAKAVRQFEEIKLSADLSLEESPLTAAWRLTEATEKDEYESGVAWAYYGQVEAWAGGTTDAWEAYQIALADAEVDRVAASGTAEITHADRLGRSNVVWVEATTAADVEFATAAYHPEEGALVERVRTIAQAEVDIAEMRGIEPYVDAQAKATRVHDQGIADANQIFYDALAAANATRDRAARQASGERIRAIAEVDRTEEVPASTTSEERAQLKKEINNRYYLALAQANGTRSIAAAQGRASWTASVGGLNAALVSDQVSAQVDRATQLQIEALTRAGAVADADVQYATRLAEASEVKAIAVARADATDTIQIAEADTELAFANTSFAGTQSIAQSVARSNYEVRLHEEHVDAKEYIYQQNSNPLAQYQAAVAAVGRDWTIAAGIARNQHTQALAQFELAHTSSVNAANIGLARLSGPINVTFATNQSALAREQSIGIASADADLYYSKKLADSNLVVAQPNVQGDADIAYATAVRDRDNAYAQANVEWVIAVTNAYVEVYSKALGTSPQFDQEYINTVNAADDRRQDAKARADEEHTRATDDAGSQVPVDLAEIRLNYVLEVAAAKTQHATAQNQVNEQFAQASAELSIKSVQDQSWLSEQHDQQAASADHARTSSLAWAEVSYEGLLRDADYGRAASRATAEVTYQIANTHEETLRLRDLAGSNPNSGYRAQTAASAAMESWITELALPYANYQAALAYHDAQLGVDISASLAIREQSRSYADLQQILANNRYASQNVVKATQAENEDLVAHTFNSGALLAALVVAENDLAVARVKADAQNVVDVDANSRKYRSSPSQRQDADKEVTLSRDEAFADAEREWRLASAGSEHEFAIAELAREQTLSLKDATIAKKLTSQNAQAERNHSIALALAEGSFWIAETAADNFHREQTAAAEADFISAQYDARAEATSDALVANLHRADGQINGITAGYATGDLVFAADNWNGSSIHGKFRVTGTTFTKHPSAGGGTQSVTPVNLGVASDDNWTGSGYMLYSATNIFTRFSAQPPLAGNADHFITVRYTGSQWEYHNNTSWYAFTPASSDVLVAEIEFFATATNTIRSLGGDLPWAGYQRDRADAERDAWASIKQAYLQHAADVSAAHTLFTSTRAHDYIQTSEANAQQSLSFRLQTAAIIADTAAAVAELQAEFSQSLAGTTSDYRQEVAEAAHKYAVDYAKAVRNNQSTTTISTALTNALEDGEEAYKSGYADLDSARVLELADVGYNLTAVTTNLLSQYVATVDGNQADFDASLADAYYAANGQSGLQKTLADLEYDYTTLEADAYASAMSDLATNHPSAWSSFTAAEADVRRDEKIVPLADQDRDRQFAYAAADRTYNLQASAGDLSQSQSATQAAMALELSRAAQMRARATAGSADDVDLPAALALPTSDSGSVTIFTSNYFVKQPGSIADGWYNGFFGYSPTSLQWSYIDAGYYFGGYDRYGYVGPYAYYGYGSEYAYMVGGYAPWNYYYGYGTYYPGYFSWGQNGWIANYGVTPPAGLAGNQAIDVAAIDEQYIQTLEILLTPRGTTGQIAATNTDMTPVRFDGSSGRLVVNDPTTAFAPSVAPDPNGPQAAPLPAGPSPRDQIEFGIPSGPQAPQSSEGLQLLADWLKSQPPIQLPPQRPISAPAVLRDPGSISAAPPPSLINRFDVQARGANGAVYIIPVGSRDEDPVYVGHKLSNGMVEITDKLGGGRAWFSALKNAANESYRIRHVINRLLRDGNLPPDVVAAFQRTTYQEIIDAVRSPFSRDPSPTNNDIGIFFGGTWDTIVDAGNVARMYSMYRGTKFYYGGVGNEVDYRTDIPLPVLSQQTLGGGFAFGWQATVDLAYNDILKFYSQHPNANIHIFGFSRGAAQGIELAKKLAAATKGGINVDYLGLYDPVYSYLLPGQWSRALAEQADEGDRGNFVQVKLTENVEKVTIIYSMNEFRTTFRATKVIPAEASSSIEFSYIAAPGVHSDIGGHWRNNANIQQLTLATMVEQAEARGAKFAGAGGLLPYAGIDPEIQKILASDYTAVLIVLTKDEANPDPTAADAFIRWRDTVSDFQFWKGYDRQTYLQRIASQDTRDWIPGPVGYLKYASQFPRTLRWVTSDLWDTYPGVSKESRFYISKLYYLYAHPDGGWRTGFGDWDQRTNDINDRRLNPYPWRITPR